MKNKFSVVLTLSLVVTIFATFFAMSNSAWYINKPEAPQELLK